MTFKAWDGLRFAALWGGLLLSTGAFASQSAQALKDYIRAHHGQLSSFSGAKIYQRSRLRADAWVDVGGTRKAIVIYKTAQASQGNIGEMFCHSALGQKERDLLEMRLLDHLQGDQPIAWRLKPQLSPKIRFIGTKDFELKTWEGWKVNLCQADSLDIKVSNPKMPDSGSINQAVYEEGKARYFSGDTDEALSRFRSLKGAGGLYQNAMAFIIPLVHEADPRLATALKTELFQFEEVTDEKALVEFAEYLERTGDYDLLDTVLVMCRERGWSCPVEIGQSPAKLYRS
jgi:hypothetical protein